MPARLIPSKREADVEFRILCALDWCYKKEKWPSQVRVAHLLGYRHGKLNGRNNRLRKKLLHKHFDV